MLPPYRLLIESGGAHSCSKQEETDEEYDDVENGLGRAQTTGPVLALVERAETVREDWGSALRALLHRYPPPFNTHARAQKM